MFGQQIQWEEVLSHLEYNHHALSTIRHQLECQSGPLDILEKLIQRYPKQLGFSLFLAATRFPTHSTELMSDIFKSLEDFTQDHMEQCVEHFQGVRRSESVTVDTLVGELMIIAFSHFHGGFTLRPSSGNLQALKLVRDRYPRSILYVDQYEYIPLHGACCAFNMCVFKYFIEWHLEMRPDGKGGLYSMNNSGITPLDSFIDTNQDITPALIWLRNRRLLQSSDVQEWLLIHRASHSSSIRTIRFFLDLYPGGILETDYDDNLPIHLHLALRYDRQPGTFSDDDFAIVQLLVSYGMIHGGIESLGGLLLPNPEDLEQKRRCALDTLLNQVGESNAERVWTMIDALIDHTTRNIEAVFIVHAVITNREHISDDLFRTIVTEYGVTTCNNDGDLPLHHAVKKGVKWDEGILEILENDSQAMLVNDVPSGLSLLPLAASVVKSNLNTIYELSKREIRLIIHATQQSSDVII